MTGSETPGGVPERRAPGGEVSEGEGASNLPARRLSAAEVEVVLRRAVELQSREGDAAIGISEGMPESELMRIGHEIGLSPRHMQQALAETSVEAEPEDGWFGRGFGPAEVRASRLLAIPEARARTDLDRYLRERETMIVYRRFAGRSVYRRGSGFAAELQRFTSGFNQPYPRIDLPEVEVGIRAADERSCFVSLRADLRGTRTGWVSGGLAGGTTAGGTLALTLGIAIAPPVALVGVPVMLGTLLGTRTGYRRAFGQKQSQLESLLDRLEHGELLPRPRGGLRDRLGF
jgi:hypothetical protein